MPGIFHQPQNRRAFLGHSARLLGAGVLGFHLCASHGAERRGSSKPFHIALLSDTHIPADPLAATRKFLPCENLKLIVPQVIAARPEAVILNGDAARLSGELGDYRQLKQLLAPLAAAAPVSIALGNHDHRGNFFKVFDEPAAGRQPLKDKHVLVIEQPVVRVIVLDSLLYANQVAGLLGQAQRQWLSQYLETCDNRATVLFVHHTLDDRDTSLLDTDRLFGLLRPHRKVKAIFYGHSHRYEFGEQQGIKLINIPAIGYNFADAEPVGWVDAEFGAEGVDLTLRAFGGNRRDDGKTTAIAWA